MIRKIHTKTSNRREDGITLVEIMVAIALTLVIIIMILPSLTSLGKANKAMIEQDSTISNSPVAKDLRSLYLPANKCASQFIDEQMSGNPYYFGGKRAVVVKQDITDCLSNIPAKSPTLQYEVKRTISGDMCVVGYDTAVDTDKYNANTPYIYHGAYANVHEDMETPCGHSPGAGESYDWEVIKSKKM